MKYKKSIIIKVGKKLGKTLVIFAGVHGNEKVGIKALKVLLTKIKIEYGKVYFVFANPKAIRLGIRNTEKDLNRSFVANNTGKTYEEKRAKILMGILNKSDALLDLHAFEYREGSPFIICEKDSYELARKMDFKFITSGWDNFDVGSTDGYMHTLRKQAICLELGSTSKTSEYLPLAISSIMQFLKYHGAVSGKIKNYNKKQIFLKLVKRIYKKADDFSFSKKFKTGDKLGPRKIFAKDGEKTYRAKKNDYIIFPDDSAGIGEEVGLVAREMWAGIGHASAPPGAALDPASAAYAASGFRFLT